MTAIDVRADKQDIAEVLVRYATGIDRRDWDLFRACFTPDVFAEYDGIGTWTDVGAITTFMVESHADMGRTMHQLSNLAIEVDRDAATARTYVDAVLTSSDGASGLNTHGYYDDELVRTADGWRISRRRFTMVHVSALGS
jgi:3-phenylpropionate/cinnamic acid dioxygenase small subunit